MKEGIIDVSHVNLIALTKAAYDLSRPQGLGFLHFTPTPLTDDEAQALVDQSKDSKQIALSLDYVNGRAVKLTVYRGKPDAEESEPELYISDRWYDHSEFQLKKLLEKVEVKAPT